MKLKDDNHTSVHISYDHAAVFIISIFYQISLPAELHVECRFFESWGRACILKVTGLGATCSYPRNEVSIEQNYREYLFGKVYVLES